MSIEENKDTVRAVFAAVDRGDLDGLMALVSPEIRTHTPIPGVGHGADAFRGFMQGFFSAFPEQSVEVHDLVASGDRVAVRHTHRGVHGGEFLGAPPSGRSFEVQGIEIFRIQDGQVTEFWHQDDLLSLLQQLGLVPSPEAVPA